MKIPSMIEGCIHRREGAEAAVYVLVYRFVLNNAVHS